MLYCNDDEKSYACEDGGKNTFHFLFVLSSETRLEDKLLKRVRL